MSLPAQTALLIACFSLSQLSCLNPFAPKLDLQPAEQLCSDLTSIENVLCTFRNAYTFKDTTLYSSVIGKEFVFTYRDYDNGVDVSWGRNDEMRITYNLFQSAESMSLIWNTEVASNGNDTAYSSVRGFNLTITFNPSDIVRLDGYANMTFGRARAADPWKIIRWRDESNF